MNWENHLTSGQAWMPGVISRILRITLRSLLPFTWERRSNILNSQLLNKWYIYQHSQRKGITSVMETNCLMILIAVTSIGHLCLHPSKQWLGYWMNLSGDFVCSNVPRKQIFYMPFDRHAHILAASLSHLELIMAWTVCWISESIMLSTISLPYSSSIALPGARNLSFAFCWSPSWDLTCLRQCMGVVATQLWQGCGMSKM